ncbi:hypothetical protein TRIUR3_34044 [Triticum urartu]|uniref:Outer envelope pore protein 37, chloroplastic n=1 Tax=Triticum urartu TaxID=4572 RepID=M7Z140_TRIUA|nr:hypothetical protein TRIUR3_34044 [Triticum urartu]
MYDVEGRNALLRGNASLPGGAVQLRASHDVKEQEGEVSVITRLGDPSYRLEISSLVPYSGLPRATLHFPIGQVSVEERTNEEDQKMLSVYGIAKTDFLDGVLTAQYNENDLNLRYCYKDNELTLVPSVSLPSNAVSLDFKRRFGSSDKLSYHFNFDTDEWNAVYKHTIGKNYKLKAGYDSEVRVGWASIWAGQEEGKAKTAPMKMKVQLMLQVPQDNIRNPSLLFRVKKSKSYLYDVLGHLFPSQRVLGHVLQPVLRSSGLPAAEVREIYGSLLLGLRVMVFGSVAFGFMVLRDHPCRDGNGVESFHFSGEKWKRRGNMKTETEICKMKMVYGSFVAQLSNNTQ